MKIPQYIDEALKKRTKAAEVFCRNDVIVSNWIDEHGLEDNIDPGDYHGGAESIFNPRESEEAIRSAILQKE